MPEVRHPPNCQPTPGVMGRGDQCPRPHSSPVLLYSLSTYYVLALRVSRVNGGVPAWESLQDPAVKVPAGTLTQNCFPMGEAYLTILRDSGSEIRLNSSGGHRAGILNQSPPPWIPDADSAAGDWGGLSGFPSAQGQHPHHCWTPKGPSLLSGPDAHTVANSLHW